MLLHESGRQSYRTGAWNSKGIWGIPRGGDQGQQRSLRLYLINPGGMFFIILPNFLAPKPFEKLFIIFFICRYCLRS